MAHDLRAFLDASALIAAGASPSGGSMLVAQVCMHGLAQARVTRLVLLEAERNLDAKFPPTALLEFYNLLGRLNPQIVPSSGRGPSRHPDRALQGRPRPGGCVNRAPHTLPHLGPQALPRPGCARGHSAHRRLHTG